MQPFLLHLKMKIARLFLPIIVVTLVVLGCEKDNVNSSFWILNDTTVHATNVQFYPNVLNRLVGGDSSGHSLIIEFVDPPITGKYRVYQNRIRIHYLGAFIEDWESTGKESDSITVNVINGKISATFNNITVDNYSTTISNLSGYLIQQ